MSGRRREEERTILDRIRLWARSESSDWTEDEWRRLMRRAESQAVVPAKPGAGAWLRPAFTTAIVGLALVAGAVFLRQGSGPAAGGAVDDRAGEMLPADPRFLLPGGPEAGRAAGIPLAVEIFESGSVLPLDSAVVRATPRVESVISLAKAGSFELHIVCEPPYAEAPGFVAVHLTLRGAKGSGAVGVLLSAAIRLETGRKTIVGRFQDGGRTLELSLTAGLRP